MASRRPIVYNYFAPGTNKSVLYWTPVCRLLRKTQLDETLNTEKKSFIILVPGEYFGVDELQSSREQRQVDPLTALV